ncbi:hypothetical protein V6N13_137256 [Hibiscus sabdariffa]|uniref:Uncharacterized protein n=1 Tax=Hibiscus sabdariffa TaxID=183260 RepID=A0ABR2DL65_9ROSI
MVNSLVPSRRPSDSTVARASIGSEGVDNVGNSCVDGEASQQPLVVPMGVDGSPAISKTSFRDMVIGRNVVGH